MITASLLLLLWACGGPTVAPPREPVAEPIPTDAVEVQPAAVPIVERPIAWDAQREALTVAYIREHYGREVATSAIEPSVVVLHWTATETLQQAFDTFDRVLLPGARSDLGDGVQANVSAHYLVDRDGTIVQLMPSTRMARHVIGLNASSIGIENVGGLPGQPLTDEQAVANARLVRELATKHELTHLIGHHQYQAFEGHPLFEEQDPAYRTSKIDPGDAFVEAVRQHVADLNLAGAPPQND